ncbi:hypothetical protein DFJ77DRAFT_448525 [Powellomyces hirtus]|nr:hypothetical protein DFJ77DRAFT_448525 [Powellomyces hirtus]
MPFTAVSPVRIKNTQEERSKLISAKSERVNGFAKDPAHYDGPSSKDTTKNGNLRKTGILQDTNRLDTAPSTGSIRRASLATQKWSPNLVRETHKLQRRSAEFRLRQSEDYNIVEKRTQEALNRVARRRRTLERLLFEHTEMLLGPPPVADVIASEAVQNISKRRSMAGLLRQRPTVNKDPLIEVERVKKECTCGREKSVKPSGHRRPQISLGDGPRSTSKKTENSSSPSLKPYQSDLPRKGVLSASSPKTRFTLGRDTKSFLSAPTLESSLSTIYPPDESHVVSTSIQQSAEDNADDTPIEPGDDTELIKETKMTIQQPFYSDLLSSFLDYLEREGELTREFLAPHPGDDMEGLLTLEQKETCVVFAQRLKLKIFDLIDLYNGYRGKMDDVLAEVEYMREKLGEDESR